MGNFIQENVNLKPYNTLGIEAIARYFATVQTAEELLELTILPMLVLGEGSNILFTKNYEGLVVKNAIKGISLIKETPDHIFIKVGAGENWHELVLYCIHHQYGGIENLSLIPGTVGAAPIQNIGAYGVELKDVFFELEAFHLKDKTRHIFTKADCQFGYRDSVFKNQYQHQYVILSVTLRLNKKPIFQTEYGAIRETLKHLQLKELTLKAVSDAVIHIRHSKLPDPKQLGNAGSFFKNPIISHAHFLELKKRFPMIPSFETEELSSIKIPAGWLIEQCGFKGKRFGEIGVYEKQALILVNYGKGSGSAIQALSDEIQAAVQAMFGIALVPEVNFV